MTTLEVPLRHVLLFTSSTVGSALALPGDEAARLWRNLGWSFEIPDDLPEVDRRCKVCDATWVGTIVETCWWCERSLVAQIAGQRLLLLREPDIDPDAHDAELQNQIDAWQARLLVGIKAELVTSAEADGAVAQWIEKVTRWRSMQ